jgi:hypothetical protein
MLILKMNILITINSLLFIFIIISLYILYINEYFILYDPGFNKVSVAPYYNPFHTYINPEKLNYLISVPDEYKTDASKSWLANKVYQCSQYDKPYTPTEPQECPDSSFTFVDNIGKFVPQSLIKHKSDLNYPGCIQLKENSNYCYSTPFGNYIPNVEVLNARSA